MADYIIKIIPSNPFAYISIEDANKITEWLREKIPAEQIDVQRTEKPQFVDCGGNLERITCSVCATNISFDWWGAQMNALHFDEGFNTLSVDTPCCHKGVSLNDLNYDFSCGFSCIEFDIYNPEEEVENSVLEKIQLTSGVEVRIIRCHL